MCFCFLDSSNLSLINYILYIHISFDDEEITKIGTDCPPCKEKNEKLFQELLDNQK